MSLTVGLEGGLGNRMRTAAAAAAIAPQISGHVVVLWAPQWGMECRFDQLFEPIVLENYELRDATLTERLTAARPRQRNLFLPSITNRLFFRHVLYNEQVYPLFRDSFDFAAWANAGRSLIWTWLDFYPWESQLLRQLFRPLPALRQRIDERCAAFSAHTIGVHIRRTDHQQAIEESPLELFTAAIDHEAELHPDLRIYLATDDEATKKALSDRYGDRILASPAEATRESADGIREALVEMLTLSGTKHIYGSAGSTFSPIAACMGKVPITILQRNGLGEIDLRCQDISPTKSISKVAHS